MGIITIKSHHRHHRSLIIPTTCIKNIYMCPEQIRVTTFVMMPPFYSCVSIYTAQTKNTRGSVAVVIRTTPVYIIIKYFLYLTKRIYR